MRLAAAVFEAAVSEAALSEAALLAAALLGCLWVVRVLPRLTGTRPLWLLLTRRGWTAPVANPPNGVAVWSPSKGLPAPGQIPPSGAATHSPRRHTPPHG
jgi:hypothetical protein